MALTREGKILLIVVDGRRKGKAEGINIPELAHMIRVLGGEDALESGRWRFFYAVEWGVAG